jgi:hypothetical protein
MLTRMVQTPCPPLANTPCPLLANMPSALVLTTWALGQSGLRNEKGSSRGTRVTPRVMMRQVAGAFAQIDHLSASRDLRLPGTCSAATSMSSSAPT